MTQLTTPEIKQHGKRHWPYVAALAAAALVAAFIVESSGRTATIDRLTIINQTEFDVEVQVSDAARDSWHVLGRANHKSSTLDEAVTDVGRTWVFQFHYGGKLVGERQISRVQLMRKRWRVEVPPRVADRMRQMGFEPPPD